MSESATIPATIPASFIAVLQRYVELRGIRAPAYGEKLAQYRARSKMENREFDALLHDLYALDPEPAFGIKIGKLVEPKDFGLVGYLLTACSTLGQALTRYGHYQTLILSTLSTWVEVGDDVISHRWNLHDVETPISCEFGVSIFITLVQSLIGKPVPPIHVGLPFATPEQPQIYRDLLQCPVTFNSECLMVDVPAKIMWMTITSRDPYMRKIFDRQAQAMLKSEGENRSDSFEEFFEALQQQVLMAMKDGDTSARSVSRQMGISLRSFYRLLANEGYSYRSIVAGLRQRLAKKYLQDPSLSYADVAMLLGYSEQSAFTRAFRDWMGITPGDYRKQKGIVLS
ncbi:MULTISPECIES: AraC family transcriptional regulator [Microbulbifer]|uniref:AraC family transcriptional regulator ligand-binding domain-containing protein n=1 Tax=Microbulbifer celer TaxID=435905 RepID=A0ABW3UBN7_9GAMM|nr:MULTISPECIES: AraC family transcriptional regulator [Microbulbifer]UFN56476.1 AraC family transcriptional regulator [Microbulbifer celer]